MPSSATTLQRDPPIGDRLRGLRQRRRLSQLALAETAGISQRHLSFVESGRSMPSRELVLSLARHLDVTPRERNTLLVAAGFAPIHRESAWSAPALEPARAAVELVLRAYEPFPALAVDRHWTLVMANAAVAPLLALVAPTLLAPPVNVLRLSLHPDGLAPRIINGAEWHEHVLQRLESQIKTSGDPTLERLHAELNDYPTPAQRTTSATSPLRDVAVPLLLETEHGVLSFIGITTIFGSPVDITLSELAIEAFLPADTSTADALRALATAQPPGAADDGE
jgi:transcriptional regulator with XRE-family HTH domain